MNDTIYRQAAIDAIYKESRLANSEVAEEYAEMYACALRELPTAQPTVASCWGCNCPKMDAQPTDADIQKMQDIEQAMLEKAYECGKQNAAQWIPCSERLPFAECGESNNVLATCGYRGGEDTSIRWIRTLYFNGGCWCYPTGETYDQKVYAWMPLPAPWEGEGNERA